MVENVVLDFGHGGLDSNGNYTTSPNKMYIFPDGAKALEGVLNRQIGKYVLECLSSHKELNVICTVGVGDPTDLSLEKRVFIVNSYDPQKTILVSIHCNASEKHNAEGFEIFTTKGKTKSDILAEHIAGSAEHSLLKVGAKLRYDMSDGDKDKESDFYVLRKSKCPAVLIECGFFDNKKEFDRLNDPSFQADFGSFVYTGIINYITKT